jgi:hypothetical protein
MTSLAYRGQAECIRDFNRLNEDAEAEQKHYNQPPQLHPDRVNPASLWAAHATEEITFD